MVRKLAHAVVACQSSLLLRSESRLREAGPNRARNTYQIHDSIALCDSNADGTCAFVQPMTRHAQVAERSS